MGCSVGRLGTSSGVSSFRENTLRLLCHAAVAVLLWHAAVTVSSSTRRAAAGGEAGGERELSDLGGVGGGMTWYWYPEFG